MTRHVNKTVGGSFRGTKHFYCTLVLLKWEYNSLRQQQQQQTQNILWVTVAESAVCFQSVILCSIHSVLIKRGRALVGCGRPPQREPVGTGVEVFAGWLSVAVRSEPDGRHKRGSHRVGL